MDVDRARHDDLASHVVRLGRVTAGWRIDDVPVTHPDIADPVAPMRGVNHAAAGDARQHGQVPPGSAAAMRAITSATDGISVWCDATFATSVPVRGSCSTLS